jgi:hypothetical protein
MNKQRQIAIALSIASVISAPVASQAADPEVQSGVHDDCRSIEIGGGAGIVGSIWTGRFPGGDLRVSVPAGGRGDVEAIVALTPASAGQTLGLYGVQYRQRLRSTDAGRLQPFLTYGGFGIFYHEGNESVITAPIIGLVGAGLEHRIGRRLAVRAEAQGIVAVVIPVGIRVAAGVSVPLGR